VLESGLDGFARDEASDKELLYNHEAQVADPDQPPRRADFGASFHAEENSTTHNFVAQASRRGVVMQRDKPDLFQATGNARQAHDHSKTMRRHVRNINKFPLCGSAQASGNPLPRRSSPESLQRKLKLGVRRSYLMLQSLDEFLRPTRNNVCC
jgi:hypothetical protein